MSVLKALARRRKFASGGVGISDPNPTLIPGGTTEPPSGRTYHPLDDADYYTYGQTGPEHLFFTGNVPVAPLRPNNLPTGGGAPQGGGGGVGGILNEITQLAGTAKTAGQLANMAGIDNQYTQAMQNPIGAIKDALGNYSLNNSVGSGQYANNALSDAGYGSNWTTPALTGLGAAGATATGVGSGAGLTASITPELIGPGEGAIAATTGAGATGTGVAGAEVGSTIGETGGTAAGLGYTAAIPAAILAYVGMGLAGSADKANSLNKSAKNQQARDSLLAYLSQHDSLGSMPADPNSMNTPEWLRPETADSYATELHLPSGLTAAQYRNLSLDEQQKYAEDWMNATGGDYTLGKVEGSSYDSSGGLKLTPRQKAIDQYAILSGGYQPDPSLPDEALADLYRTGASAYGYGLARGGRSFETGAPGVLAYASDPKFNGKVAGPGTGRSDEIPAKLSDGEYVMDAETVSMLGDGSTEAGARKLDQLRANLRKHKGKKLSRGKFSDNAKNPAEYIR